MAHDTALLGAYMASRNMLASEGFTLATGDITQALTNSHRTQPGVTQITSFTRTGAAATEFATERGFMREKAAVTALYDDVTPPSAPAKKHKSERVQ